MAHEEQIRTTACTCANGWRRKAWQMLDSIFEQRDRKAELMRAGWFRAWVFRQSVADKLGHEWWETVAEVNTDWARLLGDDEWFVMNHGEAMFWECELAK